MPPEERTAAADAAAASSPASEPDRGPSPTPLAVDPTDHLKWARATARGVRHRYGFLRGSQEEKELEATAYLVVCEYARRFDPQAAYWRGAAAAIESACRRWTPRCRAASPQFAAVPFAGADFGPPATAVAGMVAAERAFPAGSDEHAALVRLALRVALARIRSFDPVGAFRGWASVEVRSRCQREAVRLRNAGTFLTCRDTSWNWQAEGLPETGDVEAGDEIREPDVPRQLQVCDDEYDEDAEWWLLWLRWCAAMVASKSRRRVAAPVGGAAGPT